MTSTPLFCNIDTTYISIHRMNWICSSFVFFYPLTPPGVAGHLHTAHFPLPKYIYNIYHYYLLYNDVLLLYNPKISVSFCLFTYFYDPPLLLFDFSYLYPFNHDIFSPFSHYTLLFPGQLLLISCIILFNPSLYRLAYALRATQLT